MIKSLLDDHGGSRVTWIEEFCQFAHLPAQISLVKAEFGRQRNRPNQRQQNVVSNQHWPCSDLPMFWTGKSLPSRLPLPPTTGSLPVSAAGRASGGHSSRQPRVRLGTSRGSRGTRAGWWWWRRWMPTRTAMTSTWWTARITPQGSWIRALHLISDSERLLVSCFLSFLLAAESNFQASEYRV